jgi:hypothetical protein
LKNFKEILLKPTLDARPWIIWIWNLTITKKEMVDQLNSLISHGFGGVIIRPGKEMVPAYLSEEFFALFKSVLEIAKQHNFGVRIADDFSMPWSGFFTDILNQNDKLRAQNLVLAETHVRHAKESFEYKTDRWKETIVLAASLKNQQVSLTDVKVLQLSDKPLDWKVQSGDWKIFVFKKEYVHDLAGGYIPNVFNTRTAQMYLQYVMNVFKKRCAKFVGSTFKGFLTEMPAYRCADGAIPWDDDLVVKFRTKYKKDILKYLPSLFHDAPQAGRIRNQIYAYLDQTMYERFALPLEVWAKKSKLSQWVLCPERNIHRANNALIDGDFHTDKGLSLVGLQNLDGTNDNYPMLRAMADLNTNEYKRGTLAVIGRNRMGAASTLQSLKDEVDLHLCGGASQIVIDGSFFSLDQRSYLKTPHNPIWYSFLGNHLKALCDYVIRMQEILHEVKFSRSLAVLSPAPAVRALFTPANSEPARLGGQLMQKTATALIRQALDFDVLSEEYLISCAIKPTGELGKSDRGSNYFGLVVPYAPLISRSLLVYLEKMVSKRGQIIFVNDLPRGTFEDGINVGVSKRIEKLINPKRSPSRVVAAEELDRALGDIPSRIKITGNDHETPEIVTAAGSTHGGTSLYLFHNRNERQEFTVKVTLPAEKHLANIDCDSGTITEVPEVTRDEAGSKFTLHLMPQRTILLAGSTAPIASPAKHAKSAISPFCGLQRNYRIVLKNQWSFEAQTLNALPLSNWNLRIGLSRESGGFSHFYESYFQIGALPSECYFALSGLTGHLAKATGADNQFEISVNGTRIDRPITPATSSAPVAAPAASMIAESQPANGVAAPPPSPEVISFIVPPGHAAARDLFGAPVTLYSIRELLVKGFNRVAVRTSGVVIDPPTMLYPPLVLGSFSIVRGQNGWIVEKPGAAVGNDSWTKYGYPYMSGVGVYKQNFEVPQQYSRLILRMSQVSGVVDLKVNGKPAGTYLWQPIEVDVTNLCESKRNELVVSVANTIDNILRMNGRASGVLGDAYLDVS